MFCLGYYKSKAQKTLLEEFLEVYSDLKTQLKVIFFMISENTRAIFYGLIISKMVYFIKL